jgi:hypothetical protein
MCHGILPRVVYFEVASSLHMYQEFKMHSFAAKLRGSAQTSTKPEAKSKVQTCATKAVAWNFKPHLLKKAPTKNIKSTDVNR